MPNTAFRELRGALSPAEFASAVRRAGREIGEQVACDARYVGRVESGEIRCPNYAYERVFRHLFPGLSLTDMGFAARETVRGRAARKERAEVRERGAQPPSSHRTPQHPESRTLFAHDGLGEVAGPGNSRVHAGGSAPGDPAAGPVHGPGPGPCSGSDSGHGSGSDSGHGSGHGPAGRVGPDSPADTVCSECSEIHEESDVLRRAFMLGGSAAALTAVPPWGGTAAAEGHGAAAAPAAATPAVPGPRRVGETEAEALEQAVRRIRLLDDRHGADVLYRRAGTALRDAYELLDSGTASRRSVTGRLHHGAGELALSVGWLAHDSERFSDARSHYAEALATARVAADPALEAHAFCNTAFLARDAGRPREAVRAAQAGQVSAERLGSAMLVALLHLREAGGWAGLGDRAACEAALGKAHTYFGRGPSDADPTWMSFFGEAELEGLEAQCWSALRDYERAVVHARRSVALQDPHFVRNRVLFTAELAGDLAASGRPEEAAEAGREALSLLGPVRSARIHGMLGAAARRLRPYAAEPGVAAFLTRHHENRLSPGV